MRILLDTHIYLWWLAGDKRLSNKSRRRIGNASQVFVSSVSIWEAAIKIGVGKLGADMDQLVDGVAASGFLALPISIAHAAATSALKGHHRDPFDRMLIAQAEVEPLRLLTADETLANYSDLIEFVQ